ncbi:unnamed protein product [Phytophthora fragariaefolia]|uniref:Unnamed protein product n=1 Tax=Phytophthora fragariaefolia TaxID=1490495 RepID=A0A9W6XTW5_9STRA|nr:unnamed protein product [Phytophthora fragariaefolia]
MAQTVYDSDNHLLPASLLGKTRDNGAVLPEEVVCCLYGMAVLDLGQRNTTRRDNDRSNRTPERTAGLKTNAAVSHRASFFATVNSKTPDTRLTETDLSSALSLSDNESPRRGKRTASTSTPSRRVDANRREQCRLSQARYRYKQRMKVKLLGEAVFILQQEISLLRVQREQTFFEDVRSVYGVIVEYFHIFRHGVDVLDGALYQSDGAQRQQVFLRYSMAPNVMLGGDQGVEALMEQWCQYSAYFQDLEFRLDDMSELSKDLVIVSASIRVTITDETLKRVFPRLSRHRRDDQPSGQQDLKAKILGVKLVGSRLRLPSTLHFEWDSVTGQIVRLETYVDFLIPLHRVFGNLEDTSFVLDGANISWDSGIGKRELNQTQ